MNRRAPMPKRSPELAWAPAPMEAAGLIHAAAVKAFTSNPPPWKPAIAIGVPDHGIVRR